MITKAYTNINTPEKMDKIQDDTTKANRNPKYIYKIPWTKVDSTTYMVTGHNTNKTHHNATMTSELKHQFSEDR